MKRIGSIILFICLTLPFVLTYSWLQLEKIMIRKAVKQQIVTGMDESRLVRLEFTNEQAKTHLKWHHSKEFEMNGQLYDVVKMEEKPDGMIYWVFADLEETHVNNQLALLLDKALNHNQQRQEKQARLISFSKNLFCENHSSTIPLNVTNHMGYKSKNSIAPLPLYFSPPAPPPRPIS